MKSLQLDNSKRIEVFMKCIGIGVVGLRFSLLSFRDCSGSVYAHDGG